MNATSEARGVGHRPLGPGFHGEPRGAAEGMATAKPDTISALRRSREELNAALIRVERMEKACRLISIVTLVVTAFSIAMPALACTVMAPILR